MCGSRCFPISRSISKPTLARPNRTSNSTLAQPEEEPTTPKPHLKVTARRPLLAAAAIAEMLGTAG